MSQADYSILNAPGPAVRADINAQLQAIVTLNSGVSAPADKFSYMLWADTAEGKLKQRNGSNTAWIEIAKLGAIFGFGFPSGTKLNFPQASAPLGWTQDASQNDRALRVVSGAGGGIGGTHNLSSPPDHIHAGPSHTHTGPSHQHEMPVAFGPNPVIYYPLANPWGTGGVIITCALTAGSGTYEVGAALSNSAGTGATGAGGTANTGNQSEKFAPKYLDVITATKD